jgi:hypothetical protein
MFTQNILVITTAPCWRLSKPPLLYSTAPLAVLMLAFVVVEIHMLKNVGEDRGK